MAANLKLTGVSKLFGRTVAVQDLHLEVNAGEFLTLLGPSGCGKSTTLRLIAGLERANSGTIELGDRVLTSVERNTFVPPEKRGMGMVFQSYAVWPHMTVEQNVAFPLKLRHVPGDEQRRRVGEVLHLVGLEGYEARGATQLSGGQQQRVALARALVHNPAVLLLDEPLSNLDAKLRDQMRLELRLLQGRLKITTIFVTHDQAEAMVLSDRIVVMNQGNVEQIGSPDEIYEQPGSRFVMDFVGRVNYLPATVLNCAEQSATIRSDDGGIEFQYARANSLRAGQGVTLCIRPEDVTLVRGGESPQPTDWPASVQEVTYLGHRVEYLLQLGKLTMQAEGPVSDRFRQGESLYLRVQRDAVRVWTHADEIGKVGAAAGP